MFAVHPRGFVLYIIVAVVEFLLSLGHCSLFAWLLVNTQIDTYTFSSLHTRIRNLACGHNTMKDSQFDKCVYTVCVCTAC